MRRALLAAVLAIAAVSPPEAAHTRRLTNCAHLWSEMRKAAPYPLYDNAAAAWRAFQAACVGDGEA